MDKPVLNGFDTKEVTLLTGKNIEAGMAITLENANKGKLPAADEHFCGVCTVERGMYLTVVLRGHTTVKYSGTDPVIGYNKLAADGNGCVKVSDNGRLILVTDVDKVNKEIDIIL